MTVTAGDKLSVGLFIVSDEVYANLTNPVKESQICLDRDTLDTLRMTAPCLREATEGEFPIGRMDGGVVYLRREVYKRSWLTTVRVFTENFAGDLLATKTGVTMTESTWKTFVSKLDEICKCIDCAVII